MSDLLISYWSEHEQDRQAALTFGQQAIGSARTGPDFANCARFVVGTGMVDALGNQLVTAIARSVADIVNAGRAPSPDDAGGFGEALMFLRSV